MGGSSLLQICLREIFLEFIGKVIRTNESHRCLVVCVTEYLTDITSNLDSLH